MARRKFTQFELDAYPKIQNIFSKMYKVNVEELFVIPIISPSGPGHEDRGLYPSIFYKRDAIEDEIIERGMYSRKYSFNPDYSVFLIEDIVKVYDFHKQPPKRGMIIKEIITLESLIQRIKDGISQGYRSQLWAFSEEMEDSVLNDPKNEAGIKTLLRMKTGPLAVIDCKDYSKKIRQKDVNKLITDAKMLGAQKCYILTNPGINIKCRECIDNLTDYDDEKISLWMIKDYNSPQLISRKEYFGRD